MQRDHLAQTDQRIIRSRTIPPRVRGDLVERPELLSRVRCWLEHGVVLVLAGAGYGKTTLLAQVTASTPDCCWLSFDEGVNEAGVLSAHLVESVSHVRAGFGASLDYSAPPAELAWELSNELAAFGDLVVVMDDVHALEDPGALELLDRLLEHRPPDTHVVLGGRRLPELPRAASTLVHAPRIEARHLAMSLQEATRLAASSVEPAITGSLDLEALVARTEGWVTGLVLAIRHGLGGSASEGGGALFSYLAEQVLAQQPSELRAFMRQLAVVERFDADFASALTGRQDAGEAIRGLQRDHLFVERSTGEDPWFRFHALMREHLHGELESENPRAVVGLHVNAAREWARRGDDIEACRHWLEAGDREAAAESLARASSRLVNTKRMGSLNPWLRRFGRAEIEARVPLLLASATVAYGQGRDSEAFSDLELAVNSYLAAGQRGDAALALYRLLHAMTVAGTQPRAGVRAAERFLPDLDPDHPSTAAARLGYAARLGHDCRFEEAEEQIAVAEVSEGAVFYELFPSYAAITRAYYVDHLRGDTVAAIDTIDAHTQKIDRARGADELVMMLGPAYAYLAVLLNRVGRYEEALSAVARMREVMESHGALSAAQRPSAWPRAVALCGLKRFDEAEDEVRRAHRLTLGTEVTAWTFRFLQPAAHIAADRGDVPVVRGYIATARSALAEFGFSFDRPQVLLDLAIAADRAGMVEERDELLDEAAGAVEEVPEARWVSARIALARAVVTEDEEERGRLAEQVVAAGREVNLGPVWRELSEEDAGALLAATVRRAGADVAAIARIASRSGSGAIGQVVHEVAALADWQRREFAAALRGGTSGELAAIDALLRDSSPEVRRAAAESRAAVTHRRRARIEISTFGGLVVRRDGVRVPDLAYGRRRSRELLAAVICHGGRVERDRVVEWLWPDLGSQQAARALRTTLHELRRALQPEVINDEAPEWILDSDGSALELRLGPDDALDLNELRAAWAASRSDRPDRLELLRAAEKLSSGEFLPEFAYEDWHAVGSEAVRELVVDVLAALAEELLVAAEPRAAAERYRRLLLVDPEREAWHRGLMRAYSEAGERAQALRQYHECRARLADGLGAEPTEMTEDLFIELLG